VEVGHLQDKFTGHFSPHIFPDLVARVSRKTTGGEKLETSKLQGYNSSFLCSGGRGSAELVEKVGMSNTGDSTISHKSKVLPEA
jgi:hypothetical protein